MAVILYIPLISAILAIIFGIVIMIWKKSLNYLVGIWLIIWGILQLLSMYTGY